MAQALNSKLLCLNRFNVIRKDCSDCTKTKGGGAAFYIRKSLSYTKLSVAGTDLDTVWIKAKIESKHIILASIYLPPDFDQQNFIDALFSVLSQPTFLAKDIILVGDFNINWNKGCVINR